MLVCVRPSVCLFVRRLSLSSRRGVVSATDRQTNRQTSRQTARDRQPNILTETGRQTDRQDQAAERSVLVEPRPVHAFFGASLSGPPCVEALRAAPSCVQTFRGARGGGQG